ncbi:threonine/serine dehydratase [Tuberibacillus sp. Marseille-P3662]|uniref:threonine/serine dehydratase n=1 Tax=Tuberibacillus sp. Marseille-P3662 TaxID=1965358 RepID=UPI003F8F5CBD
MNNDEVTMAHVWKAKRRIRSLVRPTPLIHSASLSDVTGANVYLKLETMHPTGAFKLRGAANKILSLSLEQQRQGVATFSTGNHGIAVAYVAKQLGIPATIYLSRRVPQTKIDQLERLGAQVEKVGENQDDAAACCYEYQDKKGYTVIKPFDDIDIIAGQGTIGLEILEACPDIDKMLVPLSGGGLLAGIALALKQTNPHIDVTGLSIEGAAVMHESLKAGHPVILPEEDTLADSLLGGIGADNLYTFKMVQRYMDHSLQVSETAIADGMIHLLTHHKMAVEGAAAVGPGWLLQQTLEPDQTVVAVISGNNVNVNELARLVTDQNHQHQM